MAAVNAWKQYGLQRTLDATELDRRYGLLKAFYYGTWAADPRWKLNTPDLYRNTRQVVKRTGAIVDCYEQLVYAGDLPTFGKELPEGTRIAIPIDPQTGNETTDEALLRAFYTLFDLWRWRSRMASIPKTAAIYGDVLVELHDDYLRGVVMPNIINPWDVPVDGLELDDADNVIAYAIEYQVTIEASTAFGRTVKAESYRYRKEVDKRAFRFYRDDKPWSDPEGHGAAEQPNPYGFVPAVWFRHEIVVGSDRGLGAFERTLMQAMEMSSLFSSAIDYQRKQFGAPIGVKGSAAARPGRTLTMPGGVTLSASTTATELEEARRAAAENVNLLPMSEDGDFVTIKFDIGQTRELLGFLDELLVSENPESRYAQLLAEVTNPTAPGIRMALAPIAARVQGVQRNHDPRMVALLQMATSMLGYRLRNDDIPADIVAARQDRYDAFRDYDLTSYGQGLMDASIPDREVFPESEREKAETVAIIDGLSLWGKKAMGVSEEELADIERRDQEAAQAQMAAFSVAGAGADQRPGPADG